MLFEATLLGKGPPEQLRLVEHQTVGVHRQLGGEVAIEALEAVEPAIVVLLEAAAALDADAVQGRTGGTAREDLRSFFVSEAAWQEDGMMKAVPKDARGSRNTQPLGLRFRALLDDHGAKGLLPIGLLQRERSSANCSQLVGCRWLRRPPRRKRAAALPPRTERRDPFWSRGRTAR